MNLGKKTGSVTPSADISPREAYEMGMPLHVVRRRFNLSRSEAEDIAPEERDKPDRDAECGY